MPAAPRAVAVVVATLAITSCTVGSATIHSAPPRAVVAAEAGSDVGNDRPTVTYDGRMVRRRVVVAIHSTAGADLASLRHRLDRALSHQHTTVFPISASVLDPAVLERLSPSLVLALPAGTTRVAAARLLRPVFANGRQVAQHVQRYDVVPVLVHDLRFTIRSARPATLAKAIAREGILSDALGSYATSVTARRLNIAYTGPLLSDDLVASVRRGMARRAHVAPRVVKVSPRSLGGTGVDMAAEPAPRPAPSVAVVQASASHDHNATSPAAGPSPGERDSPFPAIAVLTLLGLTLLQRRRRASTEREAGRARSLGGDSH
jgi:hypothetical protein